MLVIYPVALNVWRSQKFSDCFLPEDLLTLFFFTLQVVLFFFFFARVSLHSLSDDLKSHFPTSAHSPVKQSTDTEAKTLKITSVGVLDDHLPLHAGTVFGYPHSRSYKRRWSVLLSSSSISVFFFFFNPPLSSVRWHPILIQACLLIHLPLFKATFPSLHSCLQTFFLFTPSLLFPAPHRLTFFFPLTLKALRRFTGPKLPLAWLYMTGAGRSAALTQWYVLIVSASAVYQSALNLASLGAGLTGCKLRLQIWFLFKGIDGKSISYSLQRLHLPHDPSFSLTCELQNITLDAVFFSPMSCCLRYTRQNCA